MSVCTFRARAYGAPMSVAITRAIWSARSVSRPAATLRILLRSAGDVADQAGNASRAAETARSTSPAEPPGTRSTTSSVAGLITSMPSPDDDVTHSPRR